MVGDELKACVRSTQEMLMFRDYHGALSAGIEARLIRREGEWSDGAARKAGEDLTGVTTIKSLSEVVDEVRRRNQVS
jgi:hypothetical protein